MKKKLAIVIVAIAIAALSVTPVFAAKGVITEVNPSGRITVVDGITDIGDITQKDPGGGSGKGSGGSKNLDSNDTAR